MRFLLSLVLTAGVAVIGWMADALDAQWVMVLPFVFLLFRSEPRPLLVSHELAATLFVVLAVATAAGTFGQYHFIYSRMWFVGLIGLLGLNNLLCIVLKLNRERDFWGAMVHTTVLLVLAGGFVKGHWKEEGMVNLYVGEVGTHMMITEMGVPTGHQRELPFPIRLDDFQVEFYESTAQILVYDLAQSQEKPSDTLAVEPGTTATIGGAEVKVVGKRKQKFVPAPNHPPIESEGLEVTVNGTRVVLPSSGQGVRQDNLGLVYHVMRGAPKLYKSKLSVLDKTGKVLKSQEVVVNDPLIHDSWWLYQSSWGEGKRGLYSGIQFVRDPGLPYVLAGMTLMLVGLAVNLLIPRRRSKA